MTPERAVTPKFFPWEFTPLYVGMPPVAQYSKPIALGGGFVEPQGFNSQPPRKKAVSKTGAEVGQCRHQGLGRPCVTHGAALLYAAGTCALSTTSVAAVNTAGDAQMQQQQPIKQLVTRLSRWLLV